MAAFAPVTQPLNVGPAGVIVAISIPAGYRQRRIAKVVAAHTGGGLSTWRLVISTDPAGADVIEKIVSYSGLRPLQVIDDDSGGRGFIWNGAETESWTVAPATVYVQVVPDGGTDNDFTIAIYVDEAD